MTLQFNNLLISMDYLISKEVCSLVSFGMHIDSIKFCPARLSLSVSTEYSFRRVNLDCIQKKGGKYKSRKRLGFKGETCLNAHPTKHD